MQIPQLHKFSLDFPHPTEANEEGIVAWGGDLNPSRLLKAYRNGIFPWNQKEEHLLWWSPDPRLILELKDFKLQRSLKKRIKHFNFKFDTDFRGVLERCASTHRKGQSGTWLYEDLIESFEVLHGMGIAHSIEAYQDNKLVGGLYGLSIGGLFCGESMFTHVNDASKAAFAVLIEHLKVWNYDFIDCQVPTEHLKSLGAKEVHREYYLMRLESVRNDEKEELWQVNNTLVTSM